jgi:hypothetical protein
VVDVSSFDNPKFGPLILQPEFAVSLEFFWGPENPQHCVSTRCAKSGDRAQNEATCVSSLDLSLLGALLCPGHTVSNLSTTAKFGSSTHEALTIGLYLESDAYGGATLAVTKHTQHSRSPRREALFHLGTVPAEPELSLTQLRNAAYNHVLRTKCNSDPSILFALLTLLPLRSLNRCELRAVVFCRMVALSVVRHLGPCVQV